MNIFHIFLSIVWYYTLYIVLKAIFNILCLIYRHYIRKPLDLKLRYGDNSWVIVTGATDGIGKGFCVEFAKLGFNIILVSRTLNKLNEVAKELKIINSNILTEVIEFDFTKLYTINDYQLAFSEIIEKKDVSILVNNVGFTDSKPFRSLTGKQSQDMININVVPQAILSELLLKAMLKRKENNPQLMSAIINLSSVASEIQNLNFIQYNAVKAFDNWHSKLMSYELKKEIDIISVKPMYVATPLTKIKPNWYHVITAENLSKSVLSQLGHDTETFGSFRHEWQAKLILCLPNILLNRAGINKK